MCTYTEIVIVLVFLKLKLSWMDISRHDRYFYFFVYFALICCENYTNRNR